MKIPETDKKKKPESETEIMIPSNLGTSLHMEAQQRHSNHLIDAAARFKSLNEHAKDMFRTQINQLGEATNDLTYEISKTSTNVSPSKLTKESLLALPEVDSVKVFHTQYGDTIAVTTKDVALKFDYRNESIPFVVPSYTIIYEPMLNDIYDGMSNETADILKDMEVQTTKVDHYKQYQIQIYFTEIEAMDVMRNTKALFCEELRPAINNNLIQAINPYVDSAGYYPVNVSTDTSGVPSYAARKICYGRNTSQQHEILAKGEIFIHLKSMLETLYTPDGPGIQGYTSWRQMVPSLITLERYFHFKAIKKIPNVFFPYYTGSADELSLMNFYPTQIVQPILSDNATEEIGKDIKARIVNSCEEFFNMRADSDDDHQFQFLHFGVRQISCRILDNEKPHQLELRYLTGYVDVMHRFTTADEENMQRTYQIEFELTEEELDSDKLSSFKINDKIYTKEEIFNHLTK